MDSLTTVMMRENRSWEALLQPYTCYHMIGPLGPQQPVPTRHIFVSQISLHPTSNKHVFFLDIPSFSSSTSRTSLSFSLSENSIYKKVTLCFSFYSLDSRRRLDGRRNWQLYPINMGSNCLHLLNHHHCHLLLRQTPTWLSAQGNFSASHA